VIAVRCAGITEISAEFTGGEAFVLFFQFLKKYLYIHIYEDTAVYLLYQEKAV